MNITYIENIRFPSERAHALQVLQTCQNLGALKHEVRLVTPERRQRKSVSEVLGVGSMPTILFTHIVLPSVDLLFSRIVPRRVAYYLQRFTFLRSCRQWKTGKKSDVWYTRDPFFVRHLAETSERWVLELHTTISKREWAIVEKRVEKFVTISHGLAAWLRERGVDDSRIRVIPDGYDPAMFANLPERASLRRELGWGSEVVFVYAGGLFPWKGVDRIVKWWPSHVKDGMRLVIVGGEEADRKRIQSLTTASTVEFVEPVSLYQVARYLRAADVGVLPTSPEYDIGRLYTSPLKLFEYLAAGLPLLASDVPSSREVLDEEVAVFFKDKNSFEAAITQLRSPAWSHPASEKALKLGSRYTWKGRAEQIEKYLLKDGVPGALKQEAVLP